jgi:hypothetical protein
VKVQPGKSTTIAFLWSDESVPAGAPASSAKTWGELQAASCRLYRNAHARQEGRM